MSVLGIISIVVCALLAVAFIALRATKGGIGALLLKILASLGFVVTGLLAIAESKLMINNWAMILIVIGLLFGMIGDIVLDLKVIYEGNDKYYLNCGMGSFFLGHVCYIVAFSLIAGETISITLPLLISLACALVLTIGITLSSKKMGLQYGNYIWQTVGYTLILTFAMCYLIALSIAGASLWLAFVGMVAFFLSDVVLSFQYFSGKIASKPLIVVNHALYYMAQIILASVLFIL